MRYEDMRNHVRDHFSYLLQRFRERTAEEGPADEIIMHALRTAETLAHSDTSEWLALTQYEDAHALLSAFCEARGISEVPDGREAKLLLAELRKGHREFVDRAIEHSSEFDTLPLEKTNMLKPAAIVTAATSNSHTPEALSVEDVLSRYFDEIERTDALADKTVSEKRDALSLMAELTDQKSPAMMSKADAQEVKAALFKLPKNRSKNPKTRDLPLTKALELDGVERIAARTMNVYLGHMQHFFGWAVDNGYASDNIFHGLRIKRTSKTKDEGRRAFTAEELSLMFSELTDEQSQLVRKDVHKWPALIGMFTGMRLNEVAQLRGHFVVSAGGPAD